jgi:pimeloyl-ACP methyl ester carboxylesterase
MVSPRYWQSLMTRRMRSAPLHLAIALAVACGSEGPVDSAAGSPTDVGADLQPTTPTYEPPGTPLSWQPCDDGFECASAELPRDYADPGGPTVALAVTRLPARDPEHRIGSLFVNPGGPGDSAIDMLHSGAGPRLAAENLRFDIVGFDPRGVGHTPGAIHCAAEAGPYPTHFVTPDNLDREELRVTAERYIDACLANNPPEAFLHATASSAARDLDVLRAAVGDERLSFLGLSYGTLIGATYASLFPDGYRALVLDGAINAEEYLERPGEYALNQTQSLELALGRFFRACAENQSSCAGLGGADPEAAFDALVARANSAPIPAGSAAAVNGEDILSLAGNAMYSKQNWRALAAALTLADRGDASSLRAMLSATEARLAPSDDQFFSLAAVEQRWESDVEAHVLRGQRSWEMFPHFWWNSSSDTWALGLFPIHATEVFRGPFHVPPTSVRVLIVATTGDPATPYLGAQVLAQVLENATLLTLDGDGHTAYGYGGGPSCINSAVEAYFADGTLPADGTVCAQDERF